MQNPTNNLCVAVIGLGYVGLPLAVEFGKKYPVIGFDINAKRVAELQSGEDHTLEVSPENVATQRCSWQNNWYTSGWFIPVLSY